MMNLIYQRDANVGAGRIPVARVPPSRTVNSLPPVSAPPIRSTAPPVATTGGPVTTGVGGPGAVQFNPDGTVKGVQTLNVDPAAPTKLDQSIIEDFSQLAAIVKKLGGSDAEAEALYTTPGTWSNSDLTPQEASAAKLDGLSPTEYAIRKGLRGLRDAVVNGGSNPNDATVIVKPPPAQVPPQSTPATLPLPGSNPINVNVQGQSNMNIALLAVGGGLAVYLISKMG